MDIVVAFIYPENDENKQRPRLILETIANSNGNGRCCGLAVYATLRTKCLREVKAAWKAEKGKQVYLTFASDIVRLLATDSITTSVPFPFCNKVEWRKSIPHCGVLAVQSPEPENVRKKVFHWLLVVKSAGRWYVIDVIGGRIIEQGASAQGIVATLRDEKGKEYEPELGDKSRYPNLDNTRFSFALDVDEVVIDKSVLDRKLTTPKSEPMRL